VTAIAPPRPISDSLRRVVLEAFTTDQLRHLAAAMEARNAVTDWLALELAEEIATIISTPPMVDPETNRLIPNVPALGWWIRRAARVRAARSS